MILVTGFGPYQEDINASGVLVNSLANNIPEKIVHLKEMLVFEVITCNDASRETEHKSLESQLDEILKRHKPELCIHTGQAPPYSKITLERIATNTFMREIIDPCRPVAYWSNLPGTNNLRSVLEEYEIPAGYSFYAGQHLCNHILYSSLYFADQYKLPHKSGFIHIPVLPEQAVTRHRNSPYMQLEMSRKALSLIIDYVAQAHGHNNQRQPVAGNCE